MLGLDSTGLSDPFITLKIYNQCVVGEKCEQTNNPSWYNKLIIKEIFLYGSLNTIVNIPPEIIMEVFDHDRFVRNLIHKFDDVLSVFYVFF